MIVLPPEEAARAMSKALNDPANVGKTWVEIFADCIRARDQAIVAAIKAVLDLNAALSRVLGK